MKLKTETRYIETPSIRMKVLVLRPKDETGKVPGILWIHGGGYALGMAEMVHFSSGKMLAKAFGGVVLSPEYRLSSVAPYPAALEDAYAALEYMDSHREELGIDRLVVGGESAGGGLAAAVCLYARDKGKVKVDFQIPLYPMLDSEDTDSSRDNHGHIWNTRRNHWGWRKYLGPLYGTDKVPSYASPSRETDYAGLPPCYTYVLDGEPFYRETLTYVENLQKAGVQARVDVFHGSVHSFDTFQFWTRKSREAKRNLREIYGKVVIKGEEFPLS